MSNNRDLLTEAIADAKAVKETEIANAKAALEESFTPHLKSMLAAKLEEMDKDDDVKESEEIQETEETVNETENQVDEAKEEVAEATEQVDEEINLDEFLAELEVAEGKEEKEVNESEELEEAKEEVSESEEIDEAAELEVTEADEDEAGEDEAEEEAPEGEEEEEIDLEDMTEDDLKKFIEDVIADMVETGELEAGPEADAEGEMGDDIEMPMMEKKEEVEETIEIDESEEIDEAKKEELDEAEEIEEAKEEVDEVANALAEVEALKSELNEVNLLNAKLLYTNKIFRSKNLTEAKKVKVLKAFDKATTVKESKVIFETLSEGLVDKVSTPINEVKGSASKALGTAPTAKQPIVESDAMVERFKKLAGII